MVDRFQSKSSFTLSAWLCTWRELPLELQVGPFHLVEREAEDATGARIERNRAVLQARQRPLQVTLVLDRLAQHDFRLLSLKPDVIVRLEQLPLHARRTHFERVMARHDVFDVQNSPHLLGN